MISFALHVSLCLLFPSTMLSWLLYLVWLPLLALSVAPFWMWECIHFDNYLGAIKLLSLVMINGIHFSGFVQMVGFY